MNAGGSFACMCHADDVGDRGIDASHLTELKRKSPWIRVKPPSHPFRVRGRWAFASPAGALRKSAALCLHDSECSCLGGICISHSSLSIEL